jgi:hypothetical protein
MQPQAIRIPVKETMGDLGQEAGTIAGIVGRGCSAMGHPSHRLERHGHDFVRAGSRSVGDEADTAGVVLACGVEGGPRKTGGVSGIVLTGTGRVDPLPIGGHGAS